jgi:GT2 family glycosyltransferase
LARPVTKCNKKCQFMVFSFEADTDLSIIIVSYDVKDLLRKCLESIFDCQRDVGFEVWVIDNRSADESGKMVKDEFAGVKLLENERNVGFSAACNQGIARSRGRYLLLLNPDTELTPGGITEMIEFMQARPRVGVCGPRMVDAKGELLFSCRSFPSYSTAISSSQSVLNRIYPGNPLSRRYLLKDLNRREEKEVDWVSGSCLLTTREIVEKIGNLDERFFMYAEDVDFCYRARRAGYRVCCFPKTVVLHHMGRSTGKRRLSMQVEHHRSMYYFYRKHHRPNVLLAGVVFLGILIRLWFSMWASFMAAGGRSTQRKSRR